MGKLLASLAVIIVAATAALFTFSLISNATPFPISYVFTWKSLDGAETGLQCTNALDDDADGGDGVGPLGTNDGCPTVGAFAESLTPGACANAIDETPDEDGVAGAPLVEDDLIVNDGCPPVKTNAVPDGAETGAQCASSLDDDGDTVVNDGCPTVGAFAESLTDGGCTNASDETPDEDGVAGAPLVEDDVIVNDGCPLVIIDAPAGNNQPGASTAVSYVNALTFGSPGSNFSGVYTTGAAPAWQIAAGAFIPTTTGSAINGGYAMGNLTSAVQLGLVNGGCATPLTVPIDMYNSTTDTTDTIEWTSDGSNLTVDFDPVQSPGDVANGTPAEVDHYPTYLNRIFDVDGPNGVVPPLRPFARFFGQVTVTPGAPPTHLSLVVFSADQIQNVAALLPAGLSNPTDDLADAFGNFNFVVLNNPVQPAAPSSVTDFCALLVTTTSVTANTNGELHLNGGNGICDDTVDDDGDLNMNDGCPVQGTPEEVSGAGPKCTDAGDVTFPQFDDDGDGWPNDGCNKVGGYGEQEGECINNSPINGLDSDADGMIDDGCIEHGVDHVGADFGEKCDGATVDDDLDGTFDEGCGTTNLVTSAAGRGILGTDTHLIRSYAIAHREAPDDGTPAHAGGGDGYENALDPCPLTDSSAWDPRFATVGVVWPGDADAGIPFIFGDGIPDDCDPFPGTYSGQAVPACAGGSGQRDEDGDCFGNRGDNCPLVWNGDNPNTLRTEGQEDLDVPAGRSVGDGGARFDGIGSACELAVAASGAAEMGGGTLVSGVLVSTACNNATSDEGTDEAPALVNDGCPAIGASESNGTYNGGPDCLDAIDDDADGGDGAGPLGTNDGCPQQGVRPEGDQCRGDPADGVGEGLDDDGDTVPDDGCDYDNDADGVDGEEPIGCSNITNDDGDANINDGCPAVGGLPPTAELPGLCADAIDNDTDGRVNDGCPAVGPACAPQLNCKEGDTDNDGLFDEDPPDDFNGDGLIAVEAATPGGVTNRSQVVAQGLADGSSAANTRAMHTHKDIQISAVCLSSSPDADGDGWCNATETLLGSIASGGGAAASRPENIAVVLTSTDSGLSLQVCNDGLDNDGDGSTDAADGGCTALGGDGDGDGALDAPDNCNTDKNDQLNTDGDAESAAGKGGDECDIDDDGDTLVDIREYARGTNAKIANTDGIGGNDRADTVTGGPLDADGDTFTDGVERVVGTDPNLKCVIGKFPGTTPTDRNLRNDADPLDIDRSGARNVTDVLKMKGRTPSPVDEYYPTETAPAFGESRLDLDGNGTVNVTDVLKFKGKTPVVCVP